MSGGYRFGARSKSKLEGVHTDLVKVMERAITKTTPIDFAVIDGVRTRERQQQLVNSGASQTMNSRHLTGHAVDIVPWVDGEISWHWDHFYPLSEGVREACVQLGIILRWGGCWQPTNRWLSARVAVSEYVARKRAAGKKAFMDGPHWEIPR